MFKSILSLAFLAFVAANADAAEADSFAFRGDSYQFSWSQQNQFEFTPEGQTDLDQWNDMITLNTHADIDTGTGLAALANNLLGIYKQHGGQVLHTDSQPRTEKQQAEHLIVVAFANAERVECVFARLTLFQGKATTLVYSKRFYGAESNSAATQWLETNSDATASDLMNLSPSAVTQQKERVLADRSTEPGK